MAAGKPFRSEDFEMHLEVLDEKNHPDAFLNVFFRRETISMATQLRRYDWSHIPAGRRHHLRLHMAAAGNAIVEEVSCESPFNRENACPRRR
jgi:hypothetical protein